jgi:formiminotetrahydrofolate cyclodeaminase
VTQPALLSESAASLLDKFGAGKASPGSGSAAALMGILAAKLLVTVCLKSKEKLDNRRSLERITYIQERIEAGERTLRELFEQDARDFAKVIELRMKRDRAGSRSEQARISREANDGLQEGTELIFRIANECLTLVDFGVSLFKEGWPHVRGDSGAAISAAISGAMSCIFIASLNAKALRGRSYAPECVARSAELTEKIQSRQSTALDCVASLSTEALDAVQLPIG